MSICSQFGAACAVSESAAPQFVTVTGSQATALFEAGAKTEAKREDDPVDHPAHYTSHPSGVECIQITKHYDFCVGNAIKYLWRAGLKHEQGKADREKQIEDLKKARWYINEEIADLSSEISIEPEAE